MLLTQTCSILNSTGDPGTATLMHTAISVIRLLVHSEFPASYGEITSEEHPEM